MIDTLHTLNLGVLQRFVVRVFWSLINANSWQVGGQQDVVRIQSVSLLRSMLMDWYATVKHRGFTEVQDLSLAMLGDGTAQNKLKTKAAETKGLTYFCLHLLDKLGGHIPNLVGPLMEAGRAITQYMECLDRYPPQPDANQCQVLFTLGMRHLRLAKAAGVELSPKHHLFIHMMRKTAIAGNPRTYATFLDESLNKVLASVCKVAYATVWELRVFANFGHLRGHGLRGTGETGGH